MIAGGTPLMDAVAFAQWAAARRLVERGRDGHVRGKRPRSGLDDIIEPRSRASRDPRPTTSSTRSGRRATAGSSESPSRLRDAGADVNWIPPWEHVSPLDAARRSGAFDVLTWLHGLGRAAPSLLGGNTEYAPEPDGWSAGLARSTGAAAGSGSGGRGIGLSWVVRRGGRRGRVARRCRFGWLTWADVTPLDGDARSITRLLWSGIRHPWPNAD